MIEDNYLVAEAMRDVLARTGCDVVGPAGSLDLGLAMAQSLPLDGALLDVNLAGHFSFPIARALSSRGVPFAFLTGYDDPTIIPLEFGGARRLSKPVGEDALSALVAEAFGGTASKDAGRVAEEDGGASPNASPRRGRE